MKIRFVRKHKPAGDAADIPTYKAGEVYDFVGAVSEGYAKKYVERGLAVEHKDEPVVEPVAAVVEEPVVEAVVEEPKAESGFPKYDLPPKIEKQHFKGNRRHGR